MGVPAGDLCGPADGLDRAALSRSRVVDTRQLHHRARRQPVERGRHVDGGAAPGEAEHIALGDEFTEQVGGDLTEVLRVG